MPLSKAVDRERSSFEASREHELTLQRTMEKELHTLEMQHQELRTKVNERNRLHESIAGYKIEIETFHARVKVIHPEI